MKIHLLTLAAGCLVLLAPMIEGAGAAEPPSAGGLKIKAVRGQEFPRDFTKAITDAGDWAQLEPLYKELETQIKAVKTPEELKVWLTRRGELGGVIGEEGARRHIAFTCATDNAEAEKANLEFIENVEPKLSEWGDKLDRLYLACPARLQSDRQWLKVLDRNLENDVKLFRPENIPLDTAETKLGQEYQKLSGAMTVNWRGGDRTQEKMALVLEDTDRQAREDSWRLVWQRRLQDHDKMNGIYDKLMGIRQQMAKNAGFENYRDFAHQAKGRFDYTPADCIQFDESVAQEVVPLLAKMRRERREQMGLKTLRPWDVKSVGSWEREVDPQGLPGLTPFKTGAELEAGCAEVFKRLSPALGGEFATMRRLGLLDLESRKGKAPGGYQSTLSEVRLPFIFMNAAGANNDVIVLLHEGGHAFHAFAARKQEPASYRHAPTEFCEVASMSMELFGASKFDVFYKNPADAKRAQRNHLKTIVQMVGWIATIDAFQQWVYTHPGHSVAEREAKWVELDGRYSPEVDWTGLEAERRAQWQRQLHLYQHPFYYVEYGIDQLAALQLWVQFRENPEAALANYQKALALGGSRPLPELFEAAGIKFDMSAPMIHKLMAAVGEELERLK